MSPTPPHPEAPALGRHPRQSDVDVDVPRAHRLLVSSRGEAAIVTNHFGANPARIEVVLTPIDITTYRPFDRHESCRLAGLSPERRYVLFVGRLDDSVKRVSTLIRAFASIAADHADTELVIVGDGPDSAAVQAVAAECLPGRVPLRAFGAGLGPGETAPPEERGQRLGRRSGALLTAGVGHGRLCHMSGRRRQVVAQLVLGSGLCPRGTGTDRAVLFRS